MKKLSILAVSFLAILYAISFSTDSYSINDDINCKCCDSTCIDNKCCIEGCGKGEGSGNCCSDKCVSETCKQCCSAGKCMMDKNTGQSSDLQTDHTGMHKSCCKSSENPCTKKCCK